MSYVIKKWTIFMSHVIFVNPNTGQQTHKAVLISILNFWYSCILISIHYSYKCSWLKFHIIIIVVYWNSFAVTRLNYRVCINIYSPDILRYIESKFMFTMIMIKIALMENVYNWTRLLDTPIRYTYWIRLLDIYWIRLLFHFTSTLRALAVRSPM